MPGQHRAQDQLGLEGEHVQRRPEEEVRAAEPGVGQHDGLGGGGRSGALRAQLSLLERRQDHEDQVRRRVGFEHEVCRVR